MTLENLCQLFESAYIAHNKAEINKKYITSSTLMFSDGKIHTSVNNEGYIIIERIDDEPNYVMFIDQHGDTFLAIYQYTIEPKYKQIIDEVNYTREQTGMKKHVKSTPVQNISNRTDDDDELSNFAGKINKRNNINKEPTAENDEILRKENDPKLININNLVCDECESNEFIEPFWRYADGRVKCKCAKCGTIYDLIPSKYYIVSSKRVFNNIDPYKINRDIQFKERKRE